MESLIIPSAKTFSPNEYLNNNSLGNSENDLDVFLIENKLKSFANLIYNWDGYNAIPTNGKVVVNTMQFFKSIPKILQEKILIDHITPTPYGTITLEWTNNESFVSIEIGENKIGFFSELPNGTAPQLESKNFNPNLIPDELVAAFEELYKVRKNS